MTFPAPSDELPQQCYIDEAIVVTAFKTRPKSQQLEVSTVTIELPKYS